MEDDHRRGAVIANARARPSRRGPHGRRAGIIGKDVVPSRR
jgi:hypothetical protein